MYLKKKDSPQCLKDKKKAKKDILNEKTNVLKASEILKQREIAFLKAKKARDEAIKNHIKALKKKEDTIISSKKLR